MTVPATDRRAGPFPGTGSITALPFTFKVFEAADLVVTKTDTDGVETTLELTTDYTVSVNGDQDSSPGGTVTPVVAPAVGESITLTSGLSYEQTLDLLTGGNFSPRAIEDAFDRTVIQIQQLAEEKNRTVRAPVSFTGDAVLPAPAAGNVLGWDDTATGLRNIDPSTLASIVAYSNRRTLVANGGAASYTLDADPGSVSNTLVAVSGVVQTPGVAYTVSGTTLTPTTPFTAGTGNVVIIYGEALPVGTQDASAVTYTPSGTGVIPTTAQSKLRERRSIFDWMSAAQIADAISGAHTLDLTSAFQSAFDSGKAVYLPPGSYRVNSAVISNVVPCLTGAGRGQTLIYAYASSGNAFEFNNAVSSYDEGLHLEGFSIIGTGTGSAVGLKIEGAVYVNSIMRDILVTAMGSHGVYIDDCLTMVMEAVRAQGNGGIGILVDQSNGIVLDKCSAESNGSHGIYLNDGGTAFGENFGATLTACHSEANGTGAVSHALYIKNHYGVTVNGGWFQCESTAGAFASSAIELDGAQHCRINGPTLSSSGTVTNLKGVGLTGALFNDIVVYCYGFAANRDVVSDASSNRNRYAGTSNQGQGALSVTDSSTLGNVRVNWSGSGGNYGQEVTANLHAMFCGANEMVRVVSTGLQLRNHTTSTSASGGAATALPGQPTGYLTININGTDRKVAYY